MKMILSSLKAYLAHGISPYGFRVDSANNLIKWTPNIFVNIIIDTTITIKTRKTWSSGVSGFASISSSNKG